MDIEILGAGRLSRTLAQLLVESNHEVTIANGSGVESLEDLSETPDPQLCPAEPKQAIRFSDMVLLAVLFHERDPPPGAARFVEKIVVDAMNPYTENFHVIDFGDDTSSELIASQLLDARSVKSFNTIHWETLRDPDHPDLPESERPAVSLAGDDSNTKARVAGLIRDIGFGPVDVGGPASGGELLEPGSAFYKCEITIEEAQDTVQTLRARQG